MAAGVPWGRWLYPQREVVAMEARRILVVANQTLGGPTLRRELQRQMDEGPCRFTLLVPATHPHEHATWTEEDARALAHRRLEAALASLREVGAEVDGMVGDESPVLAVNDALIGNRFDEIILSTLPSGASRWLKQDLPHRIERRFKLPVTTVIAERMPSPT
jgi:hypothetical protein